LFTCTSLNNLAHSLIGSWLVSWSASLTNFVAFAFCRRQNQLEPPHRIAISYFHNFVACFEYFDIISVVFLEGNIYNRAGFCRLCKTCAHFSYYSNSPALHLLNFRHKLIPLRRNFLSWIFVFHFVYLNFWTFLSLRCTDDGRTHTHTRARTRGHTHTRDEGRQTETERKARHRRWAREKERGWTKTNAAWQILLLCRCCCCYYRCCCCRRCCCTIYKSFLRLQIIFALVIEYLFAFSLAGPLSSQYMYIYIFNFFSQASHVRAFSPIFIFATHTSCKIIYFINYDLHLFAY